MILQLLKKIPPLVFLLRIKQIRIIYLKLRSLQIKCKVNLIHIRYSSVLRRKKKIIKNKKIRVAFFITQKQLWCSQSIYDSLSENEYFEPVIFAFPNEGDIINGRDVTCKENYDYFYKKNMNVIYGYNIENNTYLDNSKLKADIVFYDQVCYTGVPKNLLWYSLCYSTLVCYVPYGYKIAKANEAHFNMDLHNYCWKVFSESNWHKKQFEIFGVLKGKNVVTSGYPKLDNYSIKKRIKSDYWKISSINSEIKKIIWAPHWTVFRETNGYSTFHKNYKFFLDYAKQNKNISWVFKPHQTLKYYLEEIGFMTKDEVKEYYAEWSNLSNGCYYNESNYFEIFKTSDALITDCGSFLAEYLPTKQPILLLVNDKSGGYNEVGSKLVDSYYKAYENNDIISFIEDVVLNNNDYLRQERLSNLHHVQPNMDGAGKFIVDYFQKALVD